MWEGWSDGEAEENGWGDSIRGGATACGGPAWGGEGPPLATGLDPGTEKRR